MTTQKGIGGGMSAPVTRNFTLSCWPGAGAFVSARELTESDRKALVLYLDPVSLVLSVPPVPGSESAMARFCRQLAREAARMAFDLDPGSAVSGEGKQT
jgi:hypothetical protein